MQAKAECKTTVPELRSRDAVLHSNVHPRRHKLEIGVQSGVIEGAPRTAGGAVKGTRRLYCSKPLLGRGGECDHRIDQVHRRPQRPPWAQTWLCAACRHRTKAPVGNNGSTCSPALAKQRVDSVFDVLTLTIRTQRRQQLQHHDVARQEKEVEQRLEERPAQSMAPRGELCVAKWHASVTPHAHRVVAPLTQRGRSRGKTIGVRSMRRYTGRRAHNSPRAAPIAACALNAGAARRQARRSPRAQPGKPSPHLPAIVL
mmetsp:Transcript_9108/g.37288  ORF Transcript_9108/g.37288 Transcript_9108/m.37288 type:complete len:257 (-) Transcript_9108:307-1077(-)